MTDTTREGFVPGIPEADYHAGSEVSKSGLDKIAPELGGSPAHYKAAQETPMMPTPAMALGTALHCALLEPGRFATEYVNTGCNDKRQKLYKEATHTLGDKALTARDADWLFGMQAAVWQGNDSNAKAARKLLSMEGDTELSAFATHEPTGLVRRCRFDLLTHLDMDGRVFAADIKKTKDASPAEFAKSVWRYRYHVQAAYYSDIYYFITGKPLDSYTFIAIEEAPPHALQVYAISDEDMALGRDLYTRDLNLVAECAAAGRWPLAPETATTTAYNAAPSILSLDAWMRERQERFL